MKKSLIGDFLDSRNGKNFFTSAYLVGVLSFMGLAQEYYSEGNCGVGLVLSIVSAACAFNAGMGVQSLTNSPSEDHQEEEPQEEVTLE